MIKKIASFIIQKKKTNALSSQFQMMEISSEFKKALLDRERALQNFDLSNTSSDHVDAAIYDIKAAEARINIILKEAKEQYAII